MKKIILCILFLFPVFVFAQNPEWVKQIGGTKFDATGPMFIDNSGNIFVTGIFRDTVDFDPGPGTYNLISNGLDDFFIMKLDSSGNFQWVSQFGASTDDGIDKLHFDMNNNIYLSGNFGDTVDFDPGPGTFNLIAQGFRNIFILKLDPNGNFLWAIQNESSTGGSALSLATDQQNNLYATGDFYTTTDFDPSPAISALSPLGGFDMYVQKLDSAGNLIWVKHFKGSLDEIGVSMVFDNNNDLCITGSFEGTVDFDPGTGTNSLTSNGSDDVFILKLDLNGNLIWVKNIGGSSSDLSSCISTDSSNNILTTGKFKNSVDFDPGIPVFNMTSSGGTNDAFIIKLNSAGNFIWAKSFSGIGEESISVHKMNGTQNLYLSGQFSNTCDFDPGPAVFSMNPFTANYQDIFLVKSDLDLNFQSAFSIGGPGFDYVTDILNNNGNLFMLGFFMDSCDFDPGINTELMYSNGFHDMFLAKYSYNQTPTSEMELMPNILVKIYPNPVNENISIEFPAVSSAIFEISDISGKSVAVLSSNAKISTINLSSFLPGMYFLKINFNGLSQTYKIIKQ